MADMKQFMVLVTELERARLDALRIVMGVSRAEVGRRGLFGGGVRALEREQRDRLIRLARVAGGAGYAGWESFVIALTERPEYRQRMPSLEELEVQYPQNDRGGATDLGAPDANSMITHEQDGSERTVVTGLAESLLEA